MSPSVTVRSEPVAPARRRRRIFYLDLVRALATALIVLTHFNNPFLTDGRYLLTNQPFGIYVGAVGVSLFLIVSGASLAVTYKGDFSLRTFYWKRFKGIYPMFWTAWVLGTLYFFVACRADHFDKSILYRSICAVQSCRPCARRRR